MLKNTISKRNMLLKILIYCNIIKLSNLRSDNSNKNRYKTFEEMLSFFKELDELVEKKKSEKRVKFVCKKGCYDCCSDYFYISKLEYFMIRQHLVSTGINIEAIIKKCKLLCQKLSETSIDEFNKLLDEEATINNSFDDTAIRTFLPCVLLENTQCSVYPVRPIICRLYGISYSYVNCDKVLKKCLKLFSSNKLSDKLILKRMIDLPYGEPLCGIDYIAANNQYLHISRPFPLFWWFGNDENYLEEYKSFIQEEISR